MVSLYFSIICYPATKKISFAKAANKMRRRSKSVGGSAKTRLRKTAKQKRRHGSITQRRRAIRAFRRETELEPLTRELNTIVEQQRATTEVLKLISSSFGDPQPVFANILASAVRICDADNGLIRRWDSDALHLVATHNMPQAFIDLRKQSPYRPLRHSPSGRMLATGGLIHIADLAADQAYLERNPLTVAAVELAGIRTMLAVPLLKDSELMGSFVVGRKEVRPFADKQIEIVQNFAAQAVVAIQNAQLLHELRETLRQQTAIADVLKVISRSAFDLQAVLDTLLGLASRVCNGDGAGLAVREGEVYRYVANVAQPDEFNALPRNRTFAPGRDSMIGRTALEGKVVHVVDLADDPEYSFPPTVTVAKVRTCLGVPLLRDGVVIGAFTIGRERVEPFTERQIELVQTFADQAGIAIETARRISALRQRTDQLGRSVAELQRERNNKLMNLEAMAASISHEVRQPLASIATHGSAALRFLKHTPHNVEEVRSALNWMISDSHRASQVFDNIRALFGKGDEGYEPIDVNELIRSVLSTVHGDLDDHTIIAGVKLAEELPKIIGHKGQLEEVLINLVRNAIEAMQTHKNDHRILQVSSCRDGDKIIVAVEDSGPGIDPKHAKGIFDAFVTTKSHGMGLGLALCQMIIDRHSGELTASPAHPRGSIFRIVLPS